MLYNRARPALFNGTEMLQSKVYSAYSDTSAIASMTQGRRDRYTYSTKAITLVTWCDDTPEARLKRSQ